MAANQTDLWIGVQRAGYGSPMLRVTFILVHRNGECARIRKAKVLQQLGFTAAVTLAWKVKAQGGG